MKMFENITYSDKSERNVLDIYLPECEEFNVLVYFHGGGMEKGSKDSVRIIAENLSEKGIAVVTPNYRLYPNAKFPQFIEDAAEAVKYAMKNMQSNGNVKGFYVGGSSAGAYLTALLAYDKRYLNACGIKTSDINGYIINSSQMTTHFNVLRERGVDTKLERIDDAAPLYYITPETEFPNVLIFTADNDMPCRYEQNMLFIKALKHVGCPDEKIKYILMENSKHCSYDKTPEFSDILFDFIKSV